MKRVLRILLQQLLPAIMLFPTDGYAERFHHIVVIVQENRTPDNLFQELCHPATACGVPPQSNQYDIQTNNWLDKNSKTGVIQPFRIPLAGAYDPGHDHNSWAAMCDRVNGACKMDGAAGEGCTGSCPKNFPFAFVSNANRDLDPYILLARAYGWANYMFQTNQGPSYPAHQFLFGATSAPTAVDDQEGTFAAENGSNGMNDMGCATTGTTVQLIDANGDESSKNRIFPCFEHETLSDLVEQSGFTWRYYTPGQNYIWTAPNSIDHICQAANGTCTGADWVANVDLAPKDVLTDIENCKLHGLSWVIPGGQNSDHPQMNNGGGPSWVASIVNAIGNSSCTNGVKRYWDDTAIIITWDDWGGWYDHEPPTIAGDPWGGYTYGYRVPLIFVSAYTPNGYINNTRMDFGAIARFIEHNFRIKEGALDFSDARTGADLLSFVDFKLPPRKFQTIPARFDAKYFIDDNSPALPPDDD